MASRSSPTVTQVERERKPTTVQNIYKLYRPELTDLLLTAFHDLATKLWQKRYINDILYGNIMQRAGVQASPHEMVRAMLCRVYGLMKEMDGSTKWNDFIKVLKKESSWAAVVKKLG